MYQQRTATVEKWEVYKQKPFNYMTTGVDPLYYKQVPTYRLPYRYPFTFFQSFPVPHMRHLGDGSNIPE